MPNILTAVQLSVIRELLSHEKVVVNISLTRKLLATVDHLNLEIEEWRTAYQRLTLEMQEATS